MRRGTLHRSPSTDAGTFGTLTLEDGTRFVTGELPWRDNAPGLSCIPPGVYLAAPYASAHLGPVYLLQGVPGRSDIMMHTGNYCGDVRKGLKSDVLGCILVASYLGALDRQPAVLASTIAMKQLLANLQGAELRLTVEG